MFYFVLCAADVKYPTHCAAAAIHSLALRPRQSTSVFQCSGSHFFSAVSMTPVKLTYVALLSTSSYTCIRFL